MMRFPKAASPLKADELFICFITYMQQGVIARLTDKGFGFIKREGEEKDLFFHKNELVDVDYDDLREGDKVEFEVEEGPKGFSAVKVKRVV